MGEDGGFCEAKLCPSERPTWMSGWEIHHGRVDITYSPELNPIEQVWSWLRQHHLANRCFESYDDILDACTTAWNDFVGDLKRVVKMCNRDWLEVSSI